jgi:hypothetical protein
MLYFIHHPDNVIIISNERGQYIDTLSNFREDLKLTRRSYPDLQDGFTSLFYKNGIQTCYTINNQFLGESPWEFGDFCIKSVEYFLEAKRERENPPKAEEVEKTLDEQKQEALNYLYRTTSDIRKSIAGSIDYIYIASWSNYRIIAEKFQEGKCSDEDLEALDIEISLRDRNETREEFVGKILANAVKYSLGSAKIAGAEKKIAIMISEAQGKDQIDEALSQIQVFFEGLTK